jgi:hypothetical protein
MPPRRVHLARVCLTRCVPPTGFLTLLAACSSTGLIGLVSCRSAPGVPFPSELFPRPQPLRLSTRSCPHAVHRCRPPSRSYPTSERTAAARLRGFAPRCESVAPHPPDRTVLRPMLSWVSVALQGSPPRRVQRCKHRWLLPRAWAAAPPVPGYLLTLAVLLGVSARQGWSWSRETATDPHGLLLPHRRPLLFGSAATLAHEFTSGPGHVAMVPVPLFGWSAAPKPEGSDAAPGRSSGRSSFR